MSTVCEHNPLGLCSECKDLKPYTVFRYNPDCNKSGEEDKCCGYFWADGKKIKTMEPAKATKVGKKILFQFHSQLPVYEGVITQEMMSLGRVKPLYSARRKMSKEELAVIATLSKSKHTDLPLSLRFGSPVIPKGDTETHNDHFIDDADILSFVEDEGGDTYYVVNF